MSYPSAHFVQPVGLARRLVVLVTLTALLAAVACTSEEKAPPPEASDAPGAALAAGEFALPAATPWPAGSWAGKIEGTNAFAAIVAGPDGLMAYVCDNDKVGEWFKADTAEGLVVASNNSGSVFSAELQGSDIAGAIILSDGTTYPFVASPAAADKPVLHRSEGFDDTSVTILGWVTLPSGEQRGLGSRAPLPSRTGSVGSRPGVGLPPPGGNLPVNPGAPSSPVTPTLPGSPVGPRFPTVPPVVFTAPPLSTTTPITIPKSPAVPDPPPPLPPANPIAPDSVNAPTAARPVQFVWTAIGDSYASGEGAPVTPGVFGPLSVPITMPDWGTPSAGATKDELQSCHRSAKAGAPVANERLKGEYPSVKFEFAHYACSGAESYDIMNDGYIGPDRGPHVPQPAQGQRAAEFADDKGDYDAVYMSIGGNDVGFGDVIKGCLFGNPLGEVWQDCEDRKPVRGASAHQGRAEMSIAQAIDLLPGNLASLDRYLKDGTNRPAVPDHILISKYPDPTRGDDGVVCGDGNGHTFGDLLSFMSAKEARWAKSEILDKGMNNNVAATADMGWIVVDGHVKTMENHGLCATNGQNFFNTNADGLATQGDDYDLPGLRETLVLTSVFVVGGGLLTVPGGFLVAVPAALMAGIAAAGVGSLSAGLVHPNVKGFAKYADAITEDMRPLVDAKLATGLRTPQRVRLAKATNNGEMTWRWDDKSTSEDRYEVKMTRLEGNAAISTQTVRLPADAQEFKLAVSGRLAARIEVQACVKNTCSDAGTAEGVNFVPAIPTGGSSGYGATRVETNGTSRTTAMASVSWNASSFALRYVIAFRQVDPAGTVAGQEQPFTPIGGVSISEPTLGTTGGHPKAVYAMKIAACSKAGCSQFSPETNVDARGTPPLTTLSVGVDSSPIRPELLAEVGNQIIANPVPLPALRPARPGGLPPTPPDGGGPNPNPNPNPNPTPNPGRPPP